jgi:hypothetical protein
MSDRVRIGGGVLMVVAAVVLFVVLRGGGSSDDGGLTVNGKKAKGAPTIKLHGGKPVGGVEELEVTSGDPVRFKVTSDIDGEVHVHGYDYEKPIKAGGSVSFDFPAKLQGGFEIEMHHGGGEGPIADLKVEPG